MGHYNHYLQVLHLGVQLQKAEALSCKPVPEPNLGLHLHFEQHHRLLSGAALIAARPEHAVEAVIHRFEFWRVKAIQRIARGIGPQAGNSNPRQQQRDQIQRTLEQAVKPVICFHGSKASGGHEATETGKTKP